jgi:cation transport regulator
MTVASGAPHALPPEGGTMPYSDLGELPDSVRNVLPRHGQEIYLAAYNNAWNEYRDAEERRDDDSREAVAHKVAWAAVKQVYEKDGDTWRRK